MVLEKLPYKKNGAIIWLCQCDCGKQVKLSATDLKRNKSCGCWKSQRMVQLNKERSFIEPEYRRLNNIWHGILSRCYDSQNISFCRYGAKGIKVCEEWHEFDNFKKWAINNNYVDNLTIDRIDNKGNYCPENCRWVTMKDQCNNRKTNCLITAFGETLNIKQWSEKTGLKPNTIAYRLAHQWSVEETLTFLPDFHNRVNKNE